MLIKRYINQFKIVINQTMHEQGGDNFFFMKSEQGEHELCSSEQK